MVSSLNVNSLKRIASLVTFFGCFQFIIVTLIAMVFYPGGYNFFFDYFSTLGRTQTVDLVPNSLASLMFLIACIIAGAVIIPFLLVIPSLFTGKKSTKNLSWIGSSVGILSVPFLWILAIFPTDVFPGTGGLHDIGSKGFFLLFAAMIVLYSIAILRNEEYHNVYGIVGIILAIFVVGYVLNTSIKGSVPFLSFIDPFWQKVLVYSFIGWAMLQVTKVWQYLGE